MTTRMPSRRAPSALLAGFTRLASAALVASAVSSTPIHAQDATEVEHPIAETGAPYAYVSWSPPGYSAEPSTTLHPLVLFLHGAGERSQLDGGASETGATLKNKMAAHGPLKLIRQGRPWFADEGAVVVAPQVIKDNWWNAGALDDLVDHLVATFRIDEERIYVTGLSMGGGGTFDYAGRYGDRTAAVMPICGASEGYNGSKLGGLPMWSFHAWGDGTVNRRSSIGWSNTWANANGATGANVLANYPSASGPDTVAATMQTATYADGAFSWAEGRSTAGDSLLRLTLYTDGSHDSWSRTYDDAAQWAWLFSFSLAERDLPEPPRPPGTSEQVLVVDNDDGGATYTGAWNDSTNATGYWGSNYRYATQNTTATATYSFDVPESGRYRVQLSWAARDDRGIAHVDVAHDGGTTRIDVDQDGAVAATATWRELGVFSLSAGRRAVVTLTADNDPDYVIADAVAIDPVDDGTEGEAAEGQDEGAVEGEGAGSEGAGLEGAGSEGAGSEGADPEGAGSEGEGSEGEGAGAEGAGSEGAGSEGAGAEGAGAEGAVVEGDDDDKKKKAVALPSAGASCAAAAGGGEVGGLGGALWALAVTARRRRRVVGTAAQ